ncbi:hypothetical protein K488DRAFT_89926 [Vararia minispora EC-137]|uniref:Uncharacterized protein n=1 Tax=Vararia minispora EC-137 TaxID=1314806 RepID=A0ACB8Q9F1_9AGAM|nr:hypothetical protein K488DRAFT_89926 [Vararia minispora EC-137]
MLAVTVAAPVRVVDGILDKRYYLCLMVWTTVVTEGTLMDIWAMWLNAWLSPKGREPPRRSSADIQDQQLPEPATLPELDVKIPHDQAMQTEIQAECYGLTPHPHPTAPHHNDGNTPNIGYNASDTSSSARLN